MAKGPISNVYITGSSANGARYPGRWEPWRMFNLGYYRRASSIVTLCLLLLVTAALMAPWRPAQTTLTTAAPALRRQFRIWGTTTMTKSMTRTTTKTNLSEPRHSQQAQSYKPPSQWEIRPALCASLTRPPPPSPPHPCVCLAYSGV